MDSPRFQAKGQKPGDNEYRDFYSQPRKGVEQRRIVISRNKLIWKIPLEKIVSFYGNYVRLRPESGMKLRPKQLPPVLCLRHQTGAIHVRSLQDRKYGIVLK
jgi:hypothetical protein